MHLTLEDNSTSTVRGKQINLHQNYPVDCFGERFHFAVNYSLTAALAAERHRVCHTSFVKLNTFLSFALAEEALYMTFQPPCQPLRQANTVASQQRGHAAFDGGCLVLSGTVGPHWFKTQHRLSCVCFLRVCLRHRGHKRIHTQKSQHSLYLTSVWTVAHQSGLLQIEISCSDLTATSVLYHRPSVSRKFLILSVGLLEKCNLKKEKK